MNFSQLLGKVKDPAVVAVCCLLYFQLSGVQAALDRTSEHLTALELWRAGEIVSSAHASERLNDLQRRLDRMEEKLR